MSEKSNVSGYFKFIHLVKQYPALHENTNQTILDSSRFRTSQKESNDCWQKIASQLGITTGECKRRWKNLKEVYTNINKRDARESKTKKWIYEDAMSFLNSKTENEPELEKVNKVEVEYQEENEEFYEVMQVDSQDEEIEYVELDINSIDNTEEYYVVQNTNPEKHYDSEDEIQFKQSLLKSNQNIIIDDKTFQKYIICNSETGDENVATVINVAEYDSENEFLITPPVIKKEAVETVIVQNSFIKKETKAMPVPVEHIVKKEKFTKNPVVKKERLSRVDELLKEAARNGGGIETFFENIAGYVIKLPPQAQAEVKMKICKIVSTAEIRLSAMQKSKKG